MDTPSRMKVFRVMVGLSQGALADRIHSHQIRVSRIERGVGPPPDPNEAAAIAEALGVSVSELFPNIVRSLLYE